MWKCAIFLNNGPYIDKSVNCVTLGNSLATSSTQAQHLNFIQSFVIICLLCVSAFWMEQTKYVVGK